MTFTITLKGALLTAIAVLTIILLVYLIILAKRLMVTLSKVNDVLDDTKIVSETAADKVQKLDGIVDGLSTSVGTVVNSIKGNQNIVAAATNVVNAASSFAGIVKRPNKKSSKRASKKED